MVKLHAKQLLSYAVNQEESIVYSESQESMRELSFWRRMGILGEWGWEVRSQVPILCMEGAPISQYGPAYQSGGDTADAQNAIPVPGSPLCSDSDGCNAPNKKSSTWKSPKQGNRDVGGETKREISEEKRLTAAMRNRGDLSYYGNLDVSN